MTERKQWSFERQGGQDLRYSRNQDLGSAYGHPSRSHDFVCRSGMFLTASLLQCTKVTRTRQIIMSKPAGGPKVKENNNWDED